MTRLLFWGLIILCALLAVRLAVQRKQRRRYRPPAKTSRRAGCAQKTSEPMVACAHCGVYLPQSDALALYGKTWCCREHAQQRGRV